MKMLLRTESARPLQVSEATAYSTVCTPDEIHPGLYSGSVQRSFRTRAIYSQTTSHCGRGIERMDIHQKGNSRSWQSGGNVSGEACRGVYQQC